MSAEGTHPEGGSAPFVAFRNFITACPTHKACKLVNGVTIHRMFGINPTGYSYDKKC